MPHIHTEPGQHDITTSAWIFREQEDGEPLALVHMHRKHGKLMQVGGHIELKETPWQTIAHEIKEESGFKLSELKILQPRQEIPEVAGAAVHPVPAIFNTHFVGNGHYHSDLGYAFIAKNEPEGKPAEGESTDLRWESISALRQAVLANVALKDVVDIYAYLAQDIVPAYYRIEATRFSLDKPSDSLLKSE